MVKKGSKWASGIIDVLGMTTDSGIDGMYVWMVWYVLIVCEYGYKKNKKVDYLTFPSV